MRAAGRRAKRAPPYRRAGRADGVSDDTRVGRPTEGRPPRLRTATAERRRRCSNTDRPVGPFLPTDRPGPGGLKGRGALGEPGRCKHLREQRDRGAWFERRLAEPSFVSAGNRRFPACSQNAMRSDDIAGRVRQAARILRILATSRVSFALSNDSESRAARRRSRLEPCERARGPRAEVESVEGFLDSAIPYLNTTAQNDRERHAYPPAGRPCRHGRPHHEGQRLHDARPA